MIILLGAPGSGKGTQSRLLAQKDGYKIFSVGEILRAEIAKDTPEGREIAAAINKGEFAPRNIVTCLLKKYVTDKHYVLDGYPRDMKQVHEFNQLVEEHQNLLAENIVVIDLLVPIEVLIARLKHRRLCRVCDAALLCEAKECTFCGHYSDDAYMRDDDCNYAAVTRRLEIFHHEKDLLKEYYTKQGVYHAIDATASVEQVYEAIKALVR